MLWDSHHETNLMDTLTFHMVSVCSFMVYIKDQLFVCISHNTLWLIVVSLLYLQHWLILHHWTFCLLSNISLFFPILSAVFPSLTFQDTNPSLDRVFLIFNSFLHHAFFCFIRFCYSRHPFARKWWLLTTFHRNIPVWSSGFLSLCFCPLSCHGPANKGKQYSVVSCTEHTQRTFVAVLLICLEASLFHLLE